MHQSNPRGTDTTVALSRRTTLKVAGAALVGAAMATSAIRAGLAAQDATPASINGVRTELLGVGFPTGQDGQVLQLIRFTLEPGATTAPHVRPGTRVNYVDRGRWGVTVVGGLVELQPAGGDRQSDREALSPGSEYILEVGDSLFIDEGAVIASRNAGDEPLVLYTSATSPADALTTTSVPTDGEATPSS